MESTELKAWRVTLTASLFFFYGFIQLNLFNAINIELVQVFKLTPAGIGELSSIFFYAQALFLLPAGLLLDRFSTKKILLCALSASIIGTGLFGMATDYKTIAMARFIVGAAGAFCFLSCIRIASRWFPSQKMALVTGVIVTMAMLGGLVAQAPMTILVHAIGWRLAMGMNTVLGLVIAALILLFLQDRPSQDQGYAAEQVQLQTLGFWQAARLVLTNRYNWLGGFYTAFLNLPVLLLGALWGIHFLVEVHQLTSIQASYATTCFFFGIILGAPAFGWLSDSVGRRVWPMVMGAILSLIVILILMYAPHLSLTMIAALFFALGLVSSSQVLSYPVIAELNSPLLTGTAVSVASLIIILSGAIFQPLFGWIMELPLGTQSSANPSIYSAAHFLNALWVLPITCIISIIAALFIKETYCKVQV